jgi:DNA-binding NarL/FixJ family response regulator
MLEVLLPGKSDKEIAQISGSTVSTVERILRKLRRRFHVDSTRRLLVHLLKHGVEPVEFTESR